MVKSLEVEASHVNGRVRELIRWFQSSPQDIQYILGNGIPFEITTLHDRGGKDTGELGHVSAFGYDPGFVAGNFEYALKRLLRDRGLQQLLKERGLENEGNVQIENNGSLGIYLVIENPESNFLYQAPLATISPMVSLGRVYANIFPPKIGDDLTTKISDGKVQAVVSPLDLFPIKDFLLAYALVNNARYHHNGSGK